MTLLKKQNSKHISTSLPLYTPEKQEKEDSISTPFLPIKYNGQIMYIRKSTSVCLFNEGERLSSDRLFRVRNTQPFNTMAAEDKQASKELNVSDIISIGDICTFHIENEIKVGKTLQFAYLRKKKRKVAREYKQKLHL